MKKIFVILIITLSFFAFVNSGNEESEDTLKVGMELQFPPFETVDTDGNPTGFSVDFAYALGKHLGREVEIINTAWTGLIPSLQSDKIDIVISSMSATDERRKTIDFSDSYGDWYIVSLLSIDTNVTTPQELNDSKYSIAVKVGTIPETIVKEELPNANLLLFDTIDAAALEVVQGRANAVIYDPLFVYETWQKNSDTTKPLFVPLKITNVAAGIKKGNDEFRKQVNEFIAEIKANGTLKTISDQYIGDVNEALIEQGAKPLFQ